ncbi:MAG: hypothetical protein ABIX28_02635 [Vicinamibacterales bacterium]
MRALFRIAAGPRLGFGHLVRARVLSRALGIERPLISLRGPVSAGASAKRLRMQLLSGTAAALVARVRPEVLVLDDPSAVAARPWCLAARRAGVPVASVHDLGTAFCGSDLAIDGSLVHPDRARRAQDVPKTLLAGAEYAVLDGRVRTEPRRRHRRSPVLIALGGGPRRSVAQKLALALREARPSLRVRVAGGLVPIAGDARQGIAWLPPQPGLARELARCRVAVTGGGLSLYEAATLGAAVVAWPVVRAQYPTVKAFDRRGLAAAILPGPRRVARAVEAILAAVDAPMPSVARARAVGLDGRGAMRVAAAVARLARTTQEARA